MDLPELTGVAREITVRQLLDRAAASVADTAGPWDGKAVDAFADERARFALEQRGFPIEIVNGATSASGNVAPLRARRVAEALQALRTSQNFQALAVLFKRVKNIARELKSDVALDRSQITEPAEKALLAELDARRPAIGTAANDGDYRHALTEIAALRPVVDRFFTEVFVMAEDERVRTARLKLMADLRDLILDLADISEIVPQTEHA